MCLYRNKIKFDPSKLDVKIPHLIPFEIQFLPKSEKWTSNGYIKANALSYSNMLISAATSSFDLSKFKMKRKASDRQNEYVAGIVRDKKHIKTIAPSFYAAFMYILEKNMSENRLAMHKHAFSVVGPNKYCSLHIPKYINTKEYLSSNFIPYWYCWQGSGSYKEFINEKTKDMSNLEKLEYEKIIHQIPKGLGFDDSQEFVNLIPDMIKKDFEPLDKTSAKLYLAFNSPHLCVPLKQQDNNLKSLQKARKYWRKIIRDYPELTEHMCWQYDTLDKNFYTFRNISSISQFLYTSVGFLQNIVQDHEQYINKEPLGDIFEKCYKELKKITRAATRHKCKRYNAILRKTGATKISI